MNRTSKKPLIQVLKLMKKKGTNMVLIDSAGAGDIVSLAGLTCPSIGHTVASVEVCCYLFFFPFPFYYGFVASEQR